MGITYHNLVKKIVFPAHDFLRKSDINGYIKYLEKNKSLNYEDIKSIQRKKLKKILDNAYINIPRYRDLRYKEDPYEFIKEFPILDREDVTEKNDSLFLKDYEKKGKFYSSGGSTGVSAKVYLSNKEYACAQATQLYWLKSIGYEYGDRIIQIGIKKKQRESNKKIKDIILNTDYIYYFELSKEERIECLLKNSNYKKVFFIGFPNIAFELMELSINNNINLKFSGILSYGENLTQNVYNNLSNYYKCPILNTYGSQEGILAASGLNIDNMEIMMENTFIEIVDDDYLTLDDGELGNILITNLNAYNMPLIRYNIKDIGSIQKGSNGKRDSLLSIAGRDNDYLYTPEGGKYHLFTVSGDANFIKYKVKNFQWHQKDIGYIQIKYVPGEYGVLSEIDKKNYTKLARKKLNSPDMKFEYIPVKELTRYRSGKIQRVINDIL